MIINIGEIFKVIGSLVALGIIVYIAVVGLKTNSEQARGGKNSKSSNSKNNEQ